jgi:hypothetical protein
VPKHRFVLNQPLAKLRDDGFDPFTMAEAIFLGSQTGEILFNEWWSDLRRLKLVRFSRLFTDPLGKCLENMAIYSDGISIASA